MPDAYEQVKEIAAEVEALYHRLIRGELDGLELTPSELDQFSRAADSMARADEILRDLALAVRERRGPSPEE